MSTLMGSLTSGRACSLALTLAALVSVPRPAFAQNVRVHVANAVGPVSAAQLARALQSQRFHECQTTLLGGTVWLRVRVDATGTLAVESARTTGEEVGLYVPCVRRVLGRVRVEASTAPGAARVAVTFPALGLARPQYPSR